MSGSLPYIRKIELQIGPLKEQDGGGEARRSLIISSDGSAKSIRIKFQVTKGITAWNIPATIVLYNLSNETKAAMVSPDAQVILRVGWGDMDLVQLFKGSLVAITSQREGAEIATTLHCFPGARNMLTAPLKDRVWNSGDVLKKMVADLAAELVSKVDASLIDVPDVTLGSQGWHPGEMTASQALDALSSLYGFSYRVVDGIFVTDRDGIPIDNLIELDNESGLLLRVEPLMMLTTNTPGWPQQMTALGVTVTTLLNPRVVAFHDPLLAGSRMRIKSKINPQLGDPDKGSEYKIMTVTHSGDSHMDDWSTRLESYTFGTGPGQNFPGQGQ